MPLRLLCIALLRTQTNHECGARPPAQDVATKVVSGSLTPIWNDVLTLPVHKTEGAALIVQVYDCDKSSGEKTSKTGRMGDQIIGTGRVTLAELTAAGDGEVVIKLTDPAAKTKAERDAGSVTLSGTVAQPAESS